MGSDFDTSVKRGTQKLIPAALYFSTNDFQLSM